MFSHPNADTMNADTYQYRKAQLARVDLDPTPYKRSVKFYSTGADGQTNQMDLTDAEYRSVKDALLDDPADSFRLVIRTSGAAFDMRDATVADMLRDIANKIDDGFTDFPTIMDDNGNDCGEASFH